MPNGEFIYIAYNGGGKSPYNNISMDPKQMRMIPLFIKHIKG
jgi:hypothetical protein